jgi:hypothetical protein
MAIYDKYGFSKNDPDYWLKTARAIGDDNGLTQDDKMKAWQELTASYQGEKRDKSAREAAKKGPSNLDPDNPAIKKAENYAKSIQNPNFKKGKKP